MTNPLEKMIMNRIGDEAVAKIKALDTKQLVEVLEHFLCEHTEILKKDADHNGKKDLDEALELFAQGFAKIALKG